MTRLVWVLAGAGAGYLASEPVARMFPTGTAGGYIYGTREKLIGVGVGAFLAFLVTR